MRTVVACNTEPLPRMSEKGLPDEAGVDEWLELLAWKSSTALSTEYAVYFVCRFIEAWLAVKRMRGDEKWRECLQEGKVRIVETHLTIVSCMYLEMLYLYAYMYRPRYVLTSFLHGILLMEGLLPSGTGQTSAPIHLFILRHSSQMASGSAYSRGFGFCKCCPSKKPSR